MKKNHFETLCIFLLALTLITLPGCNSKPSRDTQNTQTTTGDTTSTITPGGSNVAFVPAARAATPAVIHIKTTFEMQGSPNPFFELFGGPQPGGGVARGSGSGVSISSDGYIATNNHVVENASEIEVIFPDRRRYKARLVGRDPSTDLALVKVDAKDLPVVKMGNSDRVEVGEWVLAIGYPFSLNTTVTAGIVSAKGRSIGILDQPRPGSFGEDAPPVGSAIESFIQTDAAINPGNSGGALVNTRGELIGINAAIASQTGSYAGYGFAIPSNLAGKILDDLKQFGEVRRGYLGVSFPAPLAEDQYYREQGIDPSKIKGVMITEVQAGSAAAEAGLKPGDIIQKMDGVTLSSSAEFSERVARHRPGDKIQLVVLSNKQPKTVTVTLKREPSTGRGSTDAASLREIYERLGATFIPLPEEYRRQFRLRSGVVVESVKRGGLFDQVGIVPGTVIVMMNGRPVNTPQDIDAILSATGNGQVRVDGIAPDGSRVIFTFSLGT